MNRKEKAAQFANDTWDITVTGRDVLVTEAMKNYAIDKFSKVERFSNRILDVSIVMDIQKLEHKVDIIMKVDHTLIRSHASSDDMYVSIDKAIDKIEAQLKRYKRRLNEHHAKPLESEELIVKVLRPTPEEEMAEINDEILSENAVREYEALHFHEIVNKKTMPLKVLTTDEAIMKIELSGDQFLVYRSEEDQKVKVLYRRDDGNYGLIETEAK